MKLTDLLTEPCVFIRVPETRSKPEFLGYLVAQAASRGLIPAEHEGDILTSLVDREGIGSSGIGDGVAVPHCRCGWVPEPVLLMATAPDGVPFDSVDQEPVRIAAVLIYPETAQRTYVQALAKVARILRNRPLRENLIRAADAAEFRKLIAREEGEEVERVSPGRAHVVMLLLNEEQYYDAGLEAFAELGILDGSVIESVLVARKLQDQLPLYAGLLGSRRREKPSRMIVGVSGDPQVGKKLMTLLRKAGCDLLRVEAGVIVVFPVSDVLGGVLEGADFA